MRYNNDKNIALLINSINTQLYFANQIYFLEHHHISFEKKYSPITFCPINKAFEIYTKLTDSYSQNSQEYDSSQHKGNQIQNTDEIPIYLTTTKCTLNSIKAMLIHNSEKQYFPCAKLSLTAINVKSKSFFGITSLLAKAELTLDIFDLLSFCWEPFIEPINLELHSSTCLNSFYIMAKILNTLNINIANTIMETLLDVKEALLSSKEASESLCSDDIYNPSNKVVFFQIVNCIDIQTTISFKGAFENQYIISPTESISITSGQIADKMFDEDDIYSKIIVSIKFGDGASIKSISDIGLIHLSHHKHVYGRGKHEYIILAATKIDGRVVFRIQYPFTISNMTSHQLQLSMPGESFLLNENGLVSISNRLYSQQICIKHSKDMSSSSEIQIKQLALPYFVMLIIR